MNEKSGKNKVINRRHFLMNSVAAVSAGTLARTGNLNAMGKMPLDDLQAGTGVRIPWRVGLVAIDSPAFLWVQEVLIFLQLWKGCKNTLNPGWELP